MIKKILLGIAGLVLLLMIVALFVPRKYSLEQKIVINKPVNEVFDYIKYLKNQDKYSKWASLDPKMKKTYEGTDATPGFVSAWESTNDEVGKGEQEITAIIQNKEVDYDLRFIKPFEGEAQSQMKTEDNGNGTTIVKWGISSSVPYPMNLMRLFVNIEEMLAKDVDFGLGNLKTQLEK